MTAPALSQAALALRFRVHQARRPRCGVCGARVFHGVHCAACTARLAPALVPRVSLTKVAYLAFCAEKRATAQVGHGKRPRCYAPKPCAKQSCRTTFQPTGPRSLYCPACQ